MSSSRLRTGMGRAWHTKGHALPQVAEAAAASVVSKCVLCGSSVCVSCAMQPLISFTEPQQLVGDIGTDAQP